MPHLHILYSPALGQACELQQLCKELALAMQAQSDEAGQAVFPLGGIRVFALAASHAAVADAQPGRDFAYLHLRMGRGRSAAVHAQVGEALAAVAKAFFAPLLASRPLGLTLQIDEGAEVFDAKFGNLHDLFKKAPHA
ncbi:5-carboxymethyl-2-hydroxymuconate isomerase [Paucibacter oligotrophus]|uniref:5-carboxymethyl-2-hydroxymuconate isomerase n=1 Tax=Roseateles oligotrophus TaxID=1769250 RepID=A0A840LG93_9BURK|nr:5-carboxymethyl-2-hydroxymuconate isomerase [Roseateles oligotrophus]MBB4845059.1 5-carboxymethyl-2-hydroxymuconate isomerase [Roseateles oligotrophus]